MYKMGKILTGVLINIFVMSKPNCLLYETRDGPLNMHVRDYLH